MEPTPITPTAPERASQEVVQERVRELTKPKMTSTQWLEVKARAEAGETYDSIALQYPVAAGTITQRAHHEAWVTPRRLQKGLKGQLSQDDPAQAAANVWLQRKEEARESTFQAMNKAFNRFAAMAPVPQTFAEAALALKMRDQAIDPDADKEQNKGNINLAVLTQVGFAPRIQE